VTALVIAEADPLDDEALSLLRKAAIEARALYPELFAPDAPWPVNVPTPPRGAFLLAHLGTEPVACGAIRPLQDRVAEVHRMYVVASARRQGVARALLAALEARAASLGFAILRLETGYRQAPAMALYESCGFRRTAAFGQYLNDPVSVCYEKSLTAQC